MDKKKAKKNIKYTVDIQVSTQVVVYASSKSDARKKAWEKFKKKPGKMTEILDPHFYHYE